jgi:hypothetical protein
MPDRWGYEPYNPHPPTQLLLQRVNAILDLYKPQRPITLRQIFYRMVAEYHYPHTQGWYVNVLSDHLTSARRAEMTTNDGVQLFDVIRDDSFIRRDPFRYLNEEDFWYRTRQNAQLYRLDRQEGQDQRIVLWCEGAGMVPQLQRIALPYGIPVYSSGKYDGITCKRDLGVEWAKLEVPIRVFHLGDHNPSGIHIFESLARDVVRFAEQTAQRLGLGQPRIMFIQIGLLPHQVTDISPDRVNPKDKRRFDWMATIIGTRGIEHRIDLDPRQAWELESLAPDQIAAIVRESIEASWDKVAYKDVLTEEERTRYVLAQRLAKANKLMVRGN